MYNSFKFSEKMLRRILKRTLISFKIGNHARLIRTPLTFSVVKKIYFSFDSKSTKSQETTNLQFCPFLDKVENVNGVTSTVKDWLQNVGATGRFQINSQGVNFQLCFKCVEDVEKFRDLLGSSLNVDKDDLSPMVHLSDFNVFKKLRIKVKLVHYLEDGADISERGEHLDRDDWNKMLDTDPNALVLDIRNSYE